MNAVELGAGAFWVLLLIGLLSGYAAMRVFRRCSDRARLRLTMNRMLAHVLELRLFLDEPPLVLRAQRDLIRENLRLLRLIALPCVILAIPFTLLMWQLDGFFGHARLIAGSPAVITLQLPEGSPTDVSLRAPPWIAIETPPVHFGARQVSWRIRPSSTGAGLLESTAGGQVYTSRVYAGRGWLGFARREHISIPYPPSKVLGINWAVWFLTGTVGGALLRRP